MNVVDLFNRAQRHQAERDALVSGIDAKRQALTFGEMQKKIDALIAV